jgi:hypothetical protein
VTAQVEVLDTREDGRDDTALEEAEIGMVSR